MLQYCLFQHIFQGARYIIQKPLWKIKYWILLCIKASLKSINVMERKFHEYSIYTWKIVILHVNHVCVMLEKN